VRAAIFNPYWDTLGGGERYVSSFVHFLLTHRFQVDIWWPVDVSSQISDRFGINITRANFISPGKSSDYDLLFWVSDGSLPISLSRKTIVHFQFPFTGVGGSSFKNFVKSRFYTFVTNSQFTKSYIDKEYRVNSHVIYPPVAVENFIPDKKQKTILYVGRFSNLTQHKGQEVLIDAFSQFSPKFPDWKLILAGGTQVGADVETLERLKKMGENLPIEFIFDPSLPELQQLYSQAGIFWSASGFGNEDLSQPTKVEHFGITVVEAMAAGCVPIVTNLGGHKEIVDNGKNGYLWSDLPQLIKITSDLVASPSSLSEISRLAVQKSKIFDIEHFNNAFSQLLNLK
jgi:glycosyltransferase involved in cell wall biosynthesis